MKKVGVRQLKNRLSAYLRQVRRGATILVTDRGKPVARIAPPDEEAKEKSLEDVLQEMAAAGHLRLPAHPKPFSDFKPIRARGKPASQMIIEDRR